MSSTTTTLLPVLTSYVSPHTGITPTATPSAASPTAPGGYSDDSQSATTYELIVFGIVAVLVQFVVAICLCIVWCRAGYNRAALPPDQQENSDNQPSVWFLTFDLSNKRS